MGDRANFGIKQINGTTIYIYGHWAGAGMMARFARALEKAGDRLNMGDDTYANRIIISQLIGEGWDSETGWGILVNELGDNEHDVPVYDYSTDTVTIYRYEWQFTLADVLANPQVIFTRWGFIQHYTRQAVGA